MKRTTLVTIEASPSGFGAYSEQLPGITGYGKSIEEAKQDLKDAIQDVLESHEEDGTLPPKFLNKGELQFKYKLDIPSLFNYFKMIDATNFARTIGMNASLLRQYKTKKTEASPKQRQKIVEGLHQLGRELLAVEA